MFLVENRFFYFYFFSFAYWQLFSLGDWGYISPLIIINGNLYDKIVVVVVVNLMLMNSTRLQRHGVNNLISLTIVDTLQWRLLICSSLCKGNMQLINEKKGKRWEAKLLLYNWYLWKVVVVVVVCYSDSSSSSSNSSKLFDDDGDKNI